MPKIRGPKESVAYTAFRLFLKNHMSLFFSWSGNSCNEPRNVFLGAKGISKLIVEVLSELTSKEDWVIRPKANKKGSSDAAPSADEPKSKEPIQQFSNIEDWIRYIYSSIGSSGIRIIF